MMLFQRSPLIQMIFPEAKILGGAGLGEITKWTVATVAGLGAFDSVAGATTIAQVTPTAGSSTVAATAGKPLSFVFQLTNYPDTPGSWKVTGSPTGLTHADAKNNKIDSLSGIPTQSGTFSVRITAYSNTNYGGDSYSKTFTMNVAVDPSAKITTNPASVTINSGGTTTLTVVASGTGPFTYQWYRGSSGTTTSPVGASAASFTTPALTTNTSYWVKVSNASTPAGVNSSAATVTVNQPAAITNHPASTTINSGGTTTLNVTAGGTAPLVYQWYRGPSGDATAPVGINSSGFTTPPLSATTSYWVKVSNMANAAGANSNAATVTVNQPASIVAHPVSVTINSGQTTTLNVVAGGTAPFTYQWYQGSGGVTTTPVGGNSPDFTTPSLLATTSYWVKVSNAANPAGAASDAAAITVPVNLPASIVSHPESISIGSGESTVLSVLAGGTAPLNYQWYEGLSGVITHPVGTDAPSFTTPALIAATSYWVKVTNSVNPAGADSNAANISILAIPTVLIGTQPDSVSINSGESTTLTVAATGTDTLAYQWYEGERGITTSPVGVNLPSFTTPSLSVSTKYWVNVSSVSNPDGVDSDAASINVLPLQPVAFGVHPVSVSINRGETTSLSVTATGSPTLIYQWYEGESGNTTIPVGTNSSSFTTPGLSLPTRYWVRVSNSLGAGDSEAALVSLLSMISIQQPVGTDLVDGTASRSFGDVVLGAGSSLSFTIRNNGVQNLTDLTITQDGANPGDYLVTGPVTATLAPVASTTFNVTFKPTAKGSRTATLHVDSSVIGEESFDINLTGSCVLPTPEIGVQQPKGSELVDGKVKKSFGTVKLGKKGSAKSYTIKNTGNANLTGIAVSRSGPDAKDFTIAAPAKTTLAPGASTTFKVTFIPKKKGTRKAEIHVKSNDANENPFDINVTGLGAP